MLAKTIHRVAIIGAGPVGLAAASTLAAKYGITAILLECGDSPGFAISQWGHVRLFTPWSMNMSSDAVSLLQNRSWTAPDSNTFPTGQELLHDYLEPLARRIFSNALFTQHRVIGISKRLDKRKRQALSPFYLNVAAPTGDITVKAHFVIDSTGTYSTPRPLGASGLSVPGEKINSNVVHYRIPHEVPGERSGPPLLRAAVVGSGDSALNAIAFLAKYCQVDWLLRGSNLPPSESKYEQKQQLAEHVLGLVSAGKVKVAFGFETERVNKTESGIQLVSGAQTVSIDHVYALTGFRPDLEITRELRIVLDPILECSRAMVQHLGSCTRTCDSPIQFHNEQLEQNEEPGFFTIGSKSFGRATDFLLQLGYQQAEIVSGAIASRLRACEHNSAAAG